VSKQINLEMAGRNTLSRTACALLLPLTLLSNKNNEIDKKEFIRSVNWIKDYRTWGKYWKELEENGVLVRLDSGKWMVCPHVCYSDGASHNDLITKWNEVCNAIN
jgi:predicted transcriptional regulator